MFLVGGGQMRERPQHIEYILFADVDAKVSRAGMQKNQGARGCSITSREVQVFI